MILSELTSGLAHPSHLDQRTQSNAGSHTAPTMAPTRPRAMTRARARAMRRVSERSWAIRRTRSAISKGHFTGGDEALRSERSATHRQNRCRSTTARYHRFRRSEGFWAGSRQRQETRQLSPSPEVASGDGESLPGYRESIGPRWQLYEEIVKRKFTFRYIGFPRMAAVEVLDFNHCLNSIPASALRSKTRRNRHPFVRSYCRPIIPVA